MRHTAAQVVGKVGALDLASKEWPDLIPALQSNVSTAPAGVKQATLEALGFVCEGLDHRALEQAQVNVVLTAVVAGMAKEQEAATRAVATKALDNALAFASVNFESKDERDYLMATVCACAEAPEPQARPRAAAKQSIKQRRRKTASRRQTAEGFALTACLPPLRCALAPAPRRTRRQAGSAPTRRRAAFQAAMRRRLSAARVRGGSLADAPRAAAAPQVREAAMECVADIVEHYYKFMQPYMGQIFEISRKTLSDGSSEEIAVQALMIWSNVCSIEENEEEGSNFHFSAAAAPQLVPLLLSVLPSKTDVDEEADEDEWSLAQEAHLCLQSLAYVVRDPVRDAVMPFVQAHVASSDWRAREAAVNAFAAIMAGPDPVTTLPMVRSALPSLLGMIKDPARPVRAAAAFAVTYCLDELHACAEEDQPPLLSPESLPPLLAVLTEALHAEDAVVGDHMVDALSKLAEGYLNAADSMPSTPLSPYFQGIVQALLQAAASAARQNAYNALSDVVASAAPADAATLGQLLPHMLQLLGAATAAPAPNAEAEQAKSEVQGNMCGVLMAITHRLRRLGEPHDAPLKLHADAMMGAYLAVATCRAGTVHAEAVLSIGALADAVGPQFEKYMAALWPVMEVGLRNFAEYEVCQVTVDLVGDVCRALETKVQPFADRIMMALLTDLASNELSATVKPGIICVFGDVALALGLLFEPYLMNVLQMLAGAAQHAAGTAAAANAADDEEAVEASCKLRTAIMEAYCGIIQGMKDDKSKLVAVAQQGPGILEFIAACCVDPHALDDPALLLAAVGLVGDVAESLPGMAAMCAQRAELSTLLQRSRSEDADDAVKEAARYTEQMVQQNMHAR